MGLILGRDPSAFDKGTEVPRGRGRSLLSQPGTEARRPSWWALLSVHILAVLPQDRNHKTVLIVTVYLACGSPQDTKPHPKVR